MNTFSTTQNARAKKMKATHPARNRYTVECGDHFWRGIAGSPEEAMMLALKKAVKDLSFLTRARSVKEGVWFYMDTTTILKKLKMYKDS